MGEMLVVVGARFKRGSEVREMVEEIRKRERERNHVHCLNFTFLRFYFYFFITNLLFNLL